LGVRVRVGLGLVVNGLCQGASGYGLGLGV
jgi:hypothetical protein